MTLAPRVTWPPLGDVERHHAFTAMIELVAAWCRDAVARAWDTGRLARVQPQEMPFARELGGLLDLAGGHSPAEAARAHEHATGTEAAYRDRFRPIHDVERAARSPLGRLAHDLGLNDVAADVLLAVAAPQLWGELARAYSILANNANRPVCDELLVGQLLSPSRASRRAVARELDEHAPLRRQGLIEMAPGVRPFAALSCPHIVIRLLEDDDLDAVEPGLPYTVRAPGPRLDDLHLAAASREQLGQALVRNGGALRLVVRGRLGSGRRTVCAAVAATSGRRLAVVDVGRGLQDGHAGAASLRALLRDIALRGWLPCLSGLERLSAEDATRAEALRSVAREHEGPLTFTAGRGASLPLEPGASLCDLEPLDTALRGAAWSATLARHGLPAELGPTLAGRTLFGPGVMDQVCRSVERPVPEAFDAAIRGVRGAQIGEIATRVTRLADKSALVLPAETLDAIHELIARVHHRHQVYAEWGFERVMTTGRGLTAMFQGGPGTGKSMVAGVIARELGLDLYRVDTSRIMSKWIGETEKNLAALFDAAEDGDVILLFDEADSLFARRTEVHTSTDRYANAAVNLLLQRLDDFEGIAILTTNFGAAIDAAVMRRLSMHVTFPFPEADARRRLWAAHLPPEAPVADDIDLARLANRFELSGGYIRNAAVRAAFLAAREGRKLAHEHLERAVVLEYRELGKLTASGRLE